MAGSGLGRAAIPIIGGLAGLAWRYGPKIAGRAMPHLMEGMMGRTGPMER